jgi:hypothetical protein
LDHPVESPALTDINQLVALRCEVRDRLVPVFDEGDFVEVRAHDRQDPVEQRLLTAVAAHEHAEDDAHG